MLLYLINLELQIQLNGGFSSFQSYGFEHAKLLDNFKRHRGVSRRPPCQIFQVKCVRARPLSIRMAGIMVSVVSRDSVQRTGFLFLSQ